MRTVILIGGGWSVSQYDVKDLREYGTVIGINEASVLAECHAGLTMDREWAEHRYHQFFTTRNGELWIRDGADKAIPQHPRRRKFWCDHESFQLSKDPNVFNGTNSGLCGINFAYQLVPSRIFLFGYDMRRGPKQQPYWYPPYPWANPEGGTKPAKFEKWAKQFDEVARQLTAAGIEVFNVNNRSAIRAFPQISYEEFMEKVK